MAALASLTSATLKDTPEDVAVLTSRAVPLMGKSLPRRSFEDFPRSYRRKKKRVRKEMGETLDRNTFQEGGTGWGRAIWV